MSQTDAHAAAAAAAPRTDSQMPQDITAQQIRALRGDRSRPDFAAELGISDNYVYMLETGRTPLVPGRTLHTLLSLLVRLQGSGKELSQAQLDTIAEAARQARAAKEPVPLDPTQVQAMVDELLRRRASST